MARIGLRMAVHDRMKFAAALIGVVFAVLPCRASRRRRSWRS
jgi:hypothetical protein